MKTKKMSAILGLAVALMVCSARVSKAQAEAPMGTAFTYQCRLVDANEAADGLYDFQFKLYDANSNGNQLGGTVDVNEVDVIDGYFTVGLDFGGSVFDGNAVWLQIGVRAGELDDPNAYGELVPRQKITPTPYALYAGTSGTAAALSGSGTSNYIAKFTDSNTIGDSVIYENGGKVGIGTAAPTAPLTIQAGIGPDVEFTSSGSNADIMASTILRVGTLTASSFHIMTNNQYRMSVDSSGNVGVGTDSPSAKLDVQGAVQVGQNGTGYDVSYYGAYSGGRLFWDQSKMALRAGRASGTEWDDANVGFYSLGIGSGVTVSGGYSAAIGRYLDAGPGGSAFVIGSGVNNSTRLTNDMDNCLMVGFNSTIPTLFVGPSSGAGTTGNVGIGTTGPEEMLDVRGNIEVDQKIKAHDSGGLELATDEGTTRLFIEDSGNVGIGTTNPSEELNVVGTILSTDPDPDGRAIQGNCFGANAYGVLGFTYGANAKSVYGAAVGTNGIAICGLASENATQAGYFDGDVHTTGKITKAFTSGTSNLATPIAYAFVSSAGAVTAGTPNVSASWDSGNSRYEITIDGESYLWSSYVTQVTLSSGPYIAATGSFDAKLLVTIYNISGTKVQAPFQFVTYRP